ncbi:uncharacterized protein LOC124171704 [Ischnura elegans]|uniref:uncharacterized protein LOC124171704 n=1 Tax=Ischnura elegans TaxID=197161 RepID=UPI001ED89293|nr:uncharacterized protein LOC124171704 [Ischnura elegans]
MYRYCLFLEVFSSLLFQEQDDEETPSNPPEALQHMEIIVEDLFPKEDMGSGKQKNEGDLHRVTAMILDHMKAFEKKKESLMVRKVNALELIAQSLARQAVAAERLQQLKASK